MQIRNEFYIEAMQKPELDFLKQKAKKDARLHFRILKFMLIGAMLVSFGGAWKNITQGYMFNVVTIFSWENYFITLLSLTIIFLIAIRILQSSELTQIKKDIRQKTKIIEKVLIERKIYLPHNNTFHFYLNSLQKLSIEVRKQDFNHWKEGDEISIEYSKNAGIYFGYF